MDRNGGCIVETATRTQKRSRFMKKALQCLILVSFFSFLHSYCSGFPCFFSSNLQFSTLIFSLFAHALDRKYMFLICHGIIAFLAKNLSFSSPGMMKSAEDCVKQITELPAVLLEEETGQENVVTAEYDVSPPDMAVAEEEEEETAQLRERDYADIHGGATEMMAEDIILEREEWEQEEDEDDELGENKAVEGTSSVVGEVNDARVSTEELNQKFEEFIRKMKEEIRIEAQQQLITV